MVAGGSCESSPAASRVRVLIAAASICLLLAAARLLSAPDVRQRIITRAAQRSRQPRALITDADLVVRWRLPGHSTFDYEGFVNG